MSRTPAWQPLTTKDKIVVVAGGMPFEHRDTEKDLENYQNFLREEWGFEDPKVETFLAKRDYYGMSDTPQKRAEYIVRALADPEVKLIFDCGGNGSDEVIEYLKKYDRDGHLPKRPDVVMCVVSDGQQLTNYLGSVGAVSPVESLPLTALCKNPKGAEAEAVRKFLFEQKIEDVGLKCFNSEARGLENLEGRMVIYNGHTRRSSYPSDVEGSILLVEATQIGASHRDVVGGFQFLLDSMKRQGQMPQAILLSKSDLLHSPETMAQITKMAEESGIPIFSGAPFGHAKGIESTPLPLNSEVKITISDGDATMSIAPVITMENIAEVTKSFESRAPYYVRPAPVSAEAISIPDLTVTRVYDQSEGEAKKDWASRVSPVIPKTNQRSWADVVRGVTEVTDQQEFLFGQAVRTCRRCEVTDFDCVDLSGKNLLLGFDGAPSEESWQQEFERWQKNDPTKTEKDYDKHLLDAARQDAQTTLMELLKTGELQKAKSLTFLMRGETPEGFHNWLQDFAKGHELKPDIFVGKAPSNAELFPDGPPKVRGYVSLVEARMKVTERSDSIEVSR